MRWPRLSDEAARARARPRRLDAWAADNLLAYLREQREATRHVPSDRTILVERFRDELGDWRLVVHSPFGAQVNGPWALAIAARMRERRGVEVHASAADDGIVLRLPDAVDDTGAEVVPTAEDVLLDPAEVEQIVVAELGGSSLYASRFRECAARALLLPRRDPKRRRPLWQQRQRSAQLLAVAGNYEQFPITLEAMRECVQDVYDLPGLRELMSDVAARKVRVAEVATRSPSPFARSLLFGYVGMFLYEADAPLAERRAAALSLDSTLLAELLGSEAIRELLDPEVLAEVEAVAAAAGARPARARRRGRGGPAAVPRPAVHRRGRGPRRGRGVAGRARGGAAGDPGAGRRRGAVDRRSRTPAGCATRSGRRCPSACRRPSPNRYRTRWATCCCATHARTGRSRRPRRGPVRPRGRGGVGRAGPAGRRGAAGPRRAAAGGRWRWRRGRPATARAPSTATPRSCGGCGGPRWPGCGPRSSPSSNARWAGSCRPGRACRSPPGGRRGRMRRAPGADDVLGVVEQLAGAPLPASALESLILPARLPGYTPALLDELTAAGEVSWTGCGALAGVDGWLALAPTDVADLLLPEPEPDVAATPLHRAVLAALGRMDLAAVPAAPGTAGDRAPGAAPPGLLASGYGGGALFFRELADRAGRVLLDDGEPAPGDDAMSAAIWDLVWAGLLTNDTLAPLRARLGGGRGGAHRTRRPAPAGPLRPVAGRAAGDAEPVGPAVGGRPVGRRAGPRTGRDPPGARPGRGVPGAARRAHARRVVDRAGRGRLRGRVPGPAGDGGFRPVPAWLRRRGSRCRAVRGTGGDRPACGPCPGRTARWAPTVPGQPAAADRRRTTAGRRRGSCSPPRTRPSPTARRCPGRIPSATPGTGRAARQGRSSCWSTGRRCCTWSGVAGRCCRSPTSARSCRPQREALAGAVHEGWLGTLAVERADGVGSLGSALADVLTEAGFRVTPKGLRLRA